ncbi:MAG TPA: response regulator [Candidatus Limnocylindrales bacterium]|nr:response regulator [Candidatus Limnocylindrales bacterium]
MNVSPHHILLVEDNADDVFFMRRALKKSGLDWSMQVVTDGQAAMDFLAGSADYADRTKFPMPSLIFLDLKLPYAGGFEVLDWIRQQPQLREIPVIILTSSPEQRDQRRAAELGVKGYLIKPPSDTVLRKVAEDWASAGITESRGMSSLAR